MVFTEAIDNTLYNAKFFWVSQIINILQYFVFYDKPDYPEF